MADLLNTGLQGLDWYQQRQSFRDARDDINTGFEQGREDIKTYQEPYQQFGLENMQGYQDQGEFSFSNEDFYRDPSYQFRLDESMKQAQRSAAGRGMLGSTNTLNTLTERAGDLASQEYGAAYDRAGDTYDRNLDRYKYGVDIGASTAQNMGNNLSELAVGRGGANAYLEGKKSEAYSNAIKSLTSTGQPGGTGGAIGGMVDAAGNWIQGAAGGAGSTLGSLGTMAGDAITGLATGSVGGMDAGDWAAKGWTSPVAGPNKLPSGGGTAGSGAAAGAAAVGTAGKAAYSAISEQMGEQVASKVLETAGPEALGGAATNLSFASWAGYAAAGVGAIFALKSVVTWLRGDSKYNTTMDTLSKSKDPLGDIQNLSSQDLISGYQGDSKYTSNLSDSAARGSLYGNIINEMEPDQIAGLKYHQDSSRIVNDLMATLNSGMQFTDKNYSGADPTAALKKMFPEIASQLDTMYGGRNAQVQQNYASQTDAGDSGWMSQAFDTGSYYQKQIDAGREVQQQVNQYIQQQMGIWTGDRMEAQALEGLV